MFPIKLQALRFSCFHTQEETPAYDTHYTSSSVLAYSPSNNFSAGGQVAPTINVTCPSVVNCRLIWKTDLNGHTVLALGSSHMYVVAFAWVARSLVKCPRY
jgi:hypothetical protein